MTDRQQRTSELRPDMVERRATWISGSVSKGLTLGKCPECRQWVSETLKGEKKGHRLRCSQPTLTTASMSVPFIGWAVAELEFGALARELAGLNVQIVRTNGCVYLVPTITEDWGLWELAEAFMRLGWLPPIDVVQTLQVIPEKIRVKNRHLWVVRGAKRTAKLMQEKATEEAKRVAQLKRVMFPVDRDD